MVPYLPKGMDRMDDILRVAWGYVKQQEVYIIYVPQGNPIKKGIQLPREVTFFQGPVVKGRNG